MRIVFVLMGMVMLSVSAGNISCAQPQWALDTVIAAGLLPTGIAISSDGRTLAVTNNTNPGTIKLISTSTYAVTTVDVSAIENFPNGVTISRDDSTALVNTLHNTIFISLTTATITGHVAAPCAGTTLYGIAVTLKGNTAVIPDLNSGCVQQGLREIDASGGTSGSTFVPVSTTGELYGIAMAADSASAIVTSFTSDSPKKVNLNTSSIQNISGLSESYGVAALHRTNEALVYDGDSLARVSLSTNSVEKRISALSYTASFQNIAITPDDRYAFAVGSFEKQVISLSADTVIQAFTAGGTNVAAMPDGSRFFVTDSYNGTVRVYAMTGTTGIDEHPGLHPSGFALSQNYPNPFNPSTTIPYALPHRSHVRLSILNTLGQNVAVLVDGMEEAGLHNIRFDGSGIASGIYFYRIQADGFMRTRKLILLR